jgi:hypothetical protein
MTRCLHLRLFALVVLLTVTAACNLSSSVNENSLPSTFNPTVVPETTPDQLPIVYYHFASISGEPIPAGSVEILPTVLILSPTTSPQPRTGDTVADVRAAIQAAISDPRNEWTSPDLSIGSVTFENAHAAVVLTGQLSGVGDIVLIAARMQFLMTVFAEPAVQSATVILNGENIGNLGISHSSEAKPADYAYTRAEIEAYMTENAYIR